MSFSFNALEASWRDEETLNFGVREQNDELLKHSWNWNKNLLFRFDGGLAAVATPFCGFVGAFCIPVCEPKFLYFIYFSFFGISNNSVLDLGCEAGLNWFILGTGIAAHK